MLDKILNLLSKNLTCIILTNGKMARPLHYQHYVKKRRQTKTF